MAAFKAEVLLVGGEWGSNSIRWPDEASAAAAAQDLWSRWTATIDHRAVEVEDEEPNRPTWDEWVAEHGLPPRSVSL